MVPQIQTCYHLLCQHSALANLKVLYAFQVHQLLQFIVKLAEHPNGKVRGSLPYMILGSCFSFILAHILISLNPGIALEDGSSKDS